METTRYWTKSGICILRGVWRSSDMYQSMTAFYLGIPFEIAKLPWPSNSTSPNKSWLVSKHCFDASVFATRWGKMSLLVTAGFMLEKLSKS